MQQTSFNAMPQDERSRKVSGAAISIGLHTLVLMAFVFWKLSYDVPYPPVEDGGGILVNFGTSDLGQGDAIPESTTKEIPTPVKTVAAPPAAKPDLLTQDFEDAPVITKPKVEKPKPNNEVKPVKVAMNSNTTTPTEATPQKPKALFPGNTNNNVTSQGNTGGTGDQGKTNGSPFTDGQSDIGGGSNSLGKGGPGIGFNLNGRSMVRKPAITDNSQKTGKVVVNIKVDRFGNVTSATATRSGSTTEDSYLFNLAQQAAMQTKFNPSSDMIEQFGTMTFTFRVR